MKENVLSHRWRGLKRITQTQQHLSALSQMAIEFELFRDMDFDDVVTEFVKKKARKKSII